MAMLVAPAFDPHLKQGCSVAEQVCLPADKLSSLLTKGGADKFRPEEHLAYEPPAKRYTISEGLGLDPHATDNRNGVPALFDFAYTAPFKLLSEEGVAAMRRAVYSEAVMKNCPFKVKDRRGGDYNHWELRNTSKYSKFIKDFWRSTSVSNAVKDALGYDVIPTMDVELGHVNLQTSLMEEVGYAAQGIHTDANAQFVCIVMLSDPTKMEGGETACRKADGSLALIKYPAAGYAIMLQGMNVLHSVIEARSTVGGLERMTMVTSYQPRDYKVPQNSLIKTLHPLGSEADRLQMCAEYASWRLQVLSNRMAGLAKQVGEDCKNGNFDLAALKRKAAELSRFLSITVDEVDPQIPPGTASTNV